MVNDEQSRGIWDWDLVKWIIGGTVLFLALLFWPGFTEDSTRQAIRWSARISVILFCIAFGASAFHRLMTNSFSFWVLMNRKYWGISFAIIHLIHLFFLILLQLYFHPVFERAATISLMGGGLAYLFIVLMLLTSFPMFAQYLSKKQWTLLHTAGGYWIWYIFMRSYWRNALEDYRYLPIAILLVLVVLLRLWKKKKAVST